MVFSGSLHPYSLPKMKSILQFWPTETVIFKDFQVQKHFPGISKDYSGAVCGGIIFAVKAMFCVLCYQLERLLKHS